SALKSSLLGTLDTSPGSGPEIVFSTSIASSTLRAIGPSLSSDQQSVMAPVRATRPKVGRSPATPQRMEGLTMLPPVSLPIAKATKPAAVAAPGPALEPDDPSSSSQGFIVCPPNQMSFSASRVQALHDCGIIGGHTVSQRLRAVRRRNSRGVEQILRSPWNAMQRAPVLAGGDLGIG